jgi:uncharacterized protein
MFKEARQKNEKLIFGLIHLNPMPGTPFYAEGDYEASIEKAVQDARALENGGAQGCLIQTVDKVYPQGNDSDYVRVACVSVVANEVRKAVDRGFKIGVQLMWNCITPSLAVARSIQAEFTRCTALIGTTVSPFGTVEANPLQAMEYRRKIGAEKVEMIAEISGYHFKGGYEKEDLLGLVGSANMIRADAVEIMGKDEATNNQMERDIRTAFPNMPIILGGGTDVSNVKTRLLNADGALVGRCFEADGWGRRIDEKIVAQYMRQVREIQ